MGIQTSFRAEDDLYHALNSLDESNTKIINKALRYYLKEVDDIGVQIKKKELEVEQIKNRLNLLRTLKEEIE